MLSNWNAQFLNQNSQRSYPLTDSCTKRDISGSVTIPDSFIVALYFPVHAGLDVEPNKFYVRTLGIYPTGFNIGLGYDDGSSNPPVVGTVNIPRSTHTENRSYAIAGVDDFDDSVGNVTIGSLDEVLDLPPGQWQFDRTGAALETDVIRPMLRGISSLTVVNNDGGRSPRLYGDIELVAGENIRIVAAQVVGQPAQITISAIEGEGLNEACVCDEELEGPPIRTLNGIPPLPDGNYRFVGDDCIAITPINNGLQFADNCSQPCCGCETLQPLEQQIDRFADGVVTLEGFINRLGAEVTQFHQVVLGSRLGDAGCVSC